MKNFLTVLFIITILISGCSPASPTTTSESMPTSTATQIHPTITATATKIPPVPTFTPTPTISLPVSQLTPVPSSNTRITAENVKDLQEIAKYYGDIDYFAKVTKDKKFLFILDPDGLTKYDYNSMEELENFPLADPLAFTRNTAGLQISDDGSWLLINNNWLLDLRNDKEPKLNILSEKIDLRNNFSKIFYLSPNGSMLAVAQSRCPNTCEHFFRIVSTENFQVLYTTSGLTSRRLAAFSSDGMYFAMADLLTVETSGGGTSSAGGTVGIWTTNEFTMISSLKLNFPFYITDIAFSDDSTLLAIAQLNSIDIMDVLSGEVIATATNLCESYNRRVMFVPSSVSKILEKSDCSSSIWTISGNTATLSTRDIPDFSRIDVDETAMVKTIPYPQLLINFKAYTSSYYFGFLNNDILSFKVRSSPYNHSCDLALANGTLDCQSNDSREDRILATDGRYYTYRVDGNQVNIYSPDNRNITFYSMPFYKYAFELLALDTINNIVFYVNYLNPYESSIVVQDMTKDHILEKWEGKTFISSIAFSENKKIAGLCRTIGYTNALNEDKLVIFDLSGKRTIYNTEFTCSGPALGMSDDGSELAIEYSYSPKPATVASRVMILNTTPPYDKKYIDFDAYYYPHAIAYSSDDSLLAVMCSKDEICFFDSSGSKEIYRLKAHSAITNLAFSKDGSLLATSSNWGLISLWAIPPFDFDPVREKISPSSFSNPITSWDFNQDGNFEGWGEQDWQYVDLGNIKVKDGYIFAETTGPDPQIYSSDSLNIDAEKYTRLEIRMRISSGDSAQIFFRNENNNWSESKSNFFSIESGSEFKTYVIDMGSVVSWKDIIAQLRLDPTSDAVGATVEIDYIHLLP